MARTAQKGEIVKQINNLKITRIKLDKNTKAGEPYLYKVFDPSGRELYSSIYLKDIEEKCKNYNAYTVKGQKQEQPKNDKTAFHKEKQSLTKEQIQVIKNAYEPVKHSKGKLKIGDKLKGQFGISRTDEEILDIWLSIIIGRGATEKQMKYCQLAQAFVNAQAQKKPLSEKAQQEQKKQRVVYIINKLYACEGMLLGLTQIKQLTNDFVSNEKIVKYMRSLDADNADYTLQDKIKKEGILGIAHSISAVIDRASDRAKKYQLYDERVNSDKYHTIAEMLTYEDKLFNKVVELHHLTKDLIRTNKYVNDKISDKKNEPILIGDSYIAILKGKDATVNVIDFTTELNTNIDNWFKDLKETHNINKEGIVILYAVDIDTAKQLFALDRASNQGAINKIIGGLKQVKSYDIAKVEVVQTIDDPFDLFDVSTDDNIFNSGEIDLDVNDIKVNTSVFSRSTIEKSSIGKSIKDMTKAEFEEQFEKVEKLLKRFNDNVIVKKSSNKLHIEGIENLRKNRLWRGDNIEFNLEIKDEVEENGTGYILGVVDKESDNINESFFDITIDYLNNNVLFEFHMESEIGENFDVEDLVDLNADLTQKLGDLTPNVMTALNNMIYNYLKTNKIVTE